MPSFFENKKILLSIGTGVLGLAYCVFMAFLINGYLTLKKEGIRDEDIVLCLTNPKINCFEKCMDPALEMPSASIDPFGHPCMDSKDHLSVYYTELGISHFDKSYCDKVYDGKIYGYFPNGGSVRNHCIMMVNDAITDAKSKSSDFFTK